MSTPERQAILAGYTRAATTAQLGHAEQQLLLRRFGIEPNWIIAENEKNRTLDRLDSLIEDLGAGDTIVCASLDRLGETGEALIARLKRIADKGIFVRTAIGDLFITDHDHDLLTALAAAGLRLRQENAGRAPRAKRPTVVTEEKVTLINELLAQEPRLTRAAIAKQVGISRARLYQHISEMNAQENAAGAQTSGLQS